MGKIIDLTEWKRKRDNPNIAETVMDQIDKLKDDHKKLEEFIRSLRDKGKRDK